MNDSPRVGVADCASDVAQQLEALGQRDLAANLPEVSCAMYEFIGKVGFAIDFAAGLQPNDVRMVKGGGDLPLLPKAPLPPLVFAKDEFESNFPRSPLLACAIHDSHATATKR